MKRNTSYSSLYDISALEIAPRFSFQRGSRALAKKKVAQIDFQG
jgi:hypothetical protein